MIDRVDQNIGRLLAKVRELGVEENTVVLFLSDNGASDEEVRSMITAIWGGRVDRYSEERAFRDGDPLHKVEMYQIGG